MKASFYVKCQRMTICSLLNKVERIACNKQLFVGRNNYNLYLAVWGRDNLFFATILAVLLLIEFNAHKLKVAP